MTHTYKVSGMTCKSCEAKVKESLLVLPGVTGVEISRENQSAAITMESHILLKTFQNVLGKSYAISAAENNEAAGEVKNWFTAYKPIWLIFGYITIVAVIISVQSGAFEWMQFMNLFMAGFFLTFSFFKMLDLEGFAESYSMYDIVAGRIKAWGFIYVFIELGLGISYATGFQPFITNSITFVVMTVSIIGVVKSILNKKKIRCACLGTVFNLPMTTVTIIEDTLMIAMSAGMLIVLV